MMCRPSTWCKLWTVYFINFCPLLNTMSYIFYLTDFWTTESSLDNNVDHRPEPALQTGQWRLGLQLRWIFTSLQMLCCRKLIKKSQNSLLSRPTSTPPHQNTTWSQFLDTSACWGNLDGVGISNQLSGHWNSLKLIHASPRPMYSQPIIFYKFNNKFWKDACLLKYRICLDRIKVGINYWRWKVRNCTSDQIT